jgi:hypothetical protein
VGDVAIAINLVSLLTAWCMSEVIRYGFFALKVGQAGRRQQQQAAACRAGQGPSSRGAAPLAASC